MDVAAIAASQVAGAAALTQQAVAMQLVKTAAEAQMQMANILAQQATAINPPQGFSVYA
ncbi:hypothetical protein [Geomonas azotofigens]|uniref:hypothetical protein n=1 Tax=Geomonas azotofigens TaxID=2843196 RepID=UPI001C1202BB|nr:hypothetical protein [Geomonas azotofigens]MBU5611420.1 hypothetical protein [Geomonas azotofigens]